jgi:16S rRNA C967 or C1407 C5-methylase (RsmB/RsmF family)
MKLKESLKEKNNIILNKKMKKLDKNFLEKLELIYSKSELETIKKGFSTENPTIFRINNLKDNYDVLKNFE